MKSKTVTVDGVELFYREAGDPSNPKVVLLGGFPSSSNQWRNLMPALAERGFHVVSPDYPGFGYTVYPDDFTFTFDRISEIIEGWLMELEFTHFGLYHQDYGGPIGNRIVGRHPEWLEWQTVQNSNAYEEGFTATWDGIRFQLWKERTKETEDALRPFLETEGIKSIYLAGHANPELISPDNWLVDNAFLEMPGAATSSSICSRTTRPTRRCTRPGSSSCVSTSRRRSSSGARATCSSPQKAATRTCGTCPTPRSIVSTPATSRPRTTSRRSPTK
jgi:pimeloyl-ACP methyl ester carboxylesterase